MDVYFIRHGQTNGNLAQRYQHPDTPLNPQGTAQARAIADTVAALEPTHIITSTYLRALETTRIVSADCTAVPETHPDFEELRRPLTMVGGRYIGFMTLVYIVRWFFGLPTNQGETYQEFLERIIRARTYLESLPNDSRVVVVSHAVFTNIFIEHLCRNTKMNFWHALQSFGRILKLRNTAIIHLTYDTSRAGVCGWNVLG
jgi:broad specificity phosphatase PhoE